MALTWERLESVPTTERAKVPGGWLVRFYYHEYDGFSEERTVYGYGGMTFYPDPEHQWDGNSLP